MVLKPPKIMRLPSNGIVFEFMIRMDLLSVMDFAMTASRALRDLKVTQANITVSFGFNLTLRGNDVHLPFLTSTATHST